MFLVLPKTRERHEVLLACFPEVGVSLRLAKVAIKSVIDWLAHKLLSRKENKVHDSPHPRDSNVKVHFDGELITAKK